MAFEVLKCHPWNVRFPQNTGHLDNLQWRQTLIFIGGALSTFLKISTFSHIIGGAKSILIL